MHDVRVSKAGSTLRVFMHEASILLQLITATLAKVVNSRNFGWCLADSCVQIGRAGIVRATDEEVADAAKGADSVESDVVLADRWTLLYR